MRNALLLIIGIPAALAAGSSSISGMTVSALQQEMAAGLKVTVVDVRSPLSYGQEHIPGAINIPASVCALKNLPPIGQVVVCGEGLGGDDTEAAAALAAKPGLQVEMLDGGFAAWKSAIGLTTRGAGLKRESLNYITYARLKAAPQENLVLVDLRKRPATGEALTDLNVEFPRARRAKSTAEALPAPSAASSLEVLIDNGDGTAEAEARKLKAGGTHSYVILAGGELILSRKGEAGLQRHAPETVLLGKKPSLMKP